MIKTSSYNHNLKRRLFASEFTEALRKGRQTATKTDQSSQHQAQQTHNFRVAALGNRHGDKQSDASALSSSSLP